MKFKMKKERILFSIIFVTLLTGCSSGGGGGGGGSSPSVITNKSVITNNKPTLTSYNNPKGKVAIMDSDFLTHKQELEKRYKSIEILEKISRNPKPNGSKHGERVLEILTEGESFHIVAASIGEKVGDKFFINPSLDIYKKVFESLKDEKVKIVNQSWGQAMSYVIKEKNLDGDIVFKPYKEYLLPLKIVKEGEGVLSENLDITKKRGEELLDFYAEKVNDGALFIWANGNVGAKGEDLYYADLHPQLPLVKSELEKGWISVIGINPNPQREGDGYVINKHYPKRLAWADGATNWSISASAEGLEGFEGTIGSSYAAPRVTRAAVLVARKFDWMDASQVRETLLTTTDRPELACDKNGIIYESEENRRHKDFRAINSAYGWGVLNTKRALKGPGAFLKEILKANYKNYGKDNQLYFKANIPKDSVSIFENNIYGDSGLIKSGKGELLLKGENTYSGKTYVEEGTLDIYKSVESDVVVENKGTLVLQNESKIGNNSKDRKVYNDGVVKVVGDVATLNGDYEVTERAKTEINENSKLEIKGKTVLGKSTLDIKVTNYPIKHEKKNILASKTIEGDIVDVAINVDGMRRGTLSKDDNGLIVELSRENAVEYIGDTEESSVNVATNIEKVLVSIDEKVANNTATEEELELGRNIVEMSVPTLKKATEKMSGEIYASAQALTFSQADNLNRSLSNHLGSLDDFKNSDYEWQGWMSGLLSTGRLTQDGYASAKTKMNGGQFGLDKKINQSTQIGVALSYSYAQADFDKYAGNSKSDGIGIALYGKKYVEKDTYVLGKVGVNKFSTRVKREILDSNLNSVDGDIKHHDKMLSTYLELGKHFKYMTPFVGYSYDFLKRGSFNESNAEWGISANSKDYIKNSVLLGIRGEYKVNDYIFRGYITHSINVGNRSLSFDGRYSGTDVNQKFKGIDLKKNTTWSGVGITKNITSQIGITGTVDFRFENGKKIDALYGVEITYKF